MFTVVCDGRLVINVYNQLVGWFSITISDLFYGFLSQQTNFTQFAPELKPNF
jgi:hypothetical protein